MAKLPRSTTEETVHTLGDESYNEQKIRHCQIDNQHVAWSTEELVVAENVHPINID